MEQDIKLTPTQQRAFEALLGAIGTTGVAVLRGKAGLGRTTVLQKMQAALGGELLGIGAFLKCLSARHALAVDEAFLAAMEESLSGHNVVLVDDLHLVSDVVRTYPYPRKNLLSAVLTSVIDMAAARGKRLVFGVDETGPPEPLTLRANVFDLDDLSERDYEHLCRSYLAPQQGEQLDYSRIHRFAPVLHAWQLKNACVALRGSGDLDTERFLAYLSSRHITSNVQLDEVRPVDWNDLKGVDDVIQALEAKIALPFENQALAAELRLKPRRGVLLAGPPGTGKTTIGRALAHRLKGKFFLIDGTVVAGTEDFYCDVRKIFHAATLNAPSVVFIDDTDLLFEKHGDQGFHRYLLTMLDGLESASAERVCVMMTAMDVSSLPPALLRSGRIELWLETRLPDREAREAILADCLSGLPHPLDRVDVGVLSVASHSLTGADLRAAVEDGKLMLAQDTTGAKKLRRVEEYFLEAIETVRANRRKYTRRKLTPFAAGRVGFGMASSVASDEGGGDSGAA